ncbi:L-threonine 3-dehydrogenase [Bacillus songklensis]|uniref:L-threonine 3-dehydrogenase n=1 Tax=Bacillus songklensis TaxID=1069116 RepID=A0ABV8AWG4_9BACI
MLRGQMKALMKHHRGAGGRLEEVDIPTLRENEVLVRVKATSICGTDVHIYKWDEWAQSRVHPPYIFGHEFAGEVVEVGQKVTNVQVGDKVSAETHLVCGACPPCLRGQYHICLRTKIIGVDTNGCFTEYVALPERNIWKNPKNMLYEVAAIQEPMGNAAHTVLSGEMTGKTVAVIGCGPIGLMAISIAQAAGASKVLAFDVNEYRLQLAKRMGATIVIHSIKEDPVKQAIKSTGGYGVDVICEMSGNPAAINQAFKMVTNGGRVSILSLPTRPVEIDVTNDIVFKGVIVQGITGRKMFSTWQQVSQLLQSGKVDMVPLLTHRFPLEKFEEAFVLMIQGNCGKVILIP